MSWDLVYRSEAQVGEGPAWDSATGTLLWVDILGQEALATDPGTGDTTSMKRPTTVGAVIPRRQGGVVLAVPGGFEFFDALADGGEPTQFVELQDEPASNRMNDAKCDPQGRLFAGTMDGQASPERGFLYRLDSDLNIQQVEQNLTISNGLGWSVDHRMMYFIDSGAYAMYAYDFPESGIPQNRRTLIEFDPEAGIPDGLCVDREDGIWVAVFGGARLERYEPSGQRTEVVSLPVPNPTSCCFGGEGDSDMYVTSASLQADLSEHPLSGSVFRIDSGVQGLPTVAFEG